MPKTAQRTPPKRTPPAKQKVETQHLVLAEILREVNAHFPDVNGRPYPKTVSIAEDVFYYRVNWRDDEGNFTKSAFVRIEKTKDGLVLTDETTNG